MIILFFVIFLISVILAIRSMKDFQVPSEIKHLLLTGKIKGTIVFLKDKIVHYRHHSSSVSSNSSGVKGR